MRRRRGPWVGMGLLIAVVAATVGFNSLTGDPIPITVVGVWLIAVGTVGTLIAASRYENPIGWLLLAIALVIAAGLFAEGYASYALESDHPLPFASSLAWVTLWLTVPGFTLFVFVFLLFPTGRAINKKWRSLMWAAAASAGVQIAFLMVKPGPIDNVPVLDNPLGAPGLATVLAPLTEVAQFVLVGSGLAAIASLVVRFRRSHGVERLQIKTVALGTLALPVAFGLVMLLATLGFEESGDGSDYFAFVMNMIGLLAIPVSIGVAILRYRLYDIDVIIKRTLVYAVLTAILGGMYFVLVIAMQGIVAPVTEQSDVAVAASTLAVAAAFRPARRHVQQFIDRRFYRSRYDVQQTLEAFSARLRDEIDLDNLTSELVAVVTSTMRPGHASLWLREVTR